MALHQDKEICSEKAKCLKRYFSDANARGLVNTEFAKFSAALDVFLDHDSLNDRGFMDPEALVGSLRFFYSNFASFSSKDSWPIMLL